MFAHSVFKVSKRQLEFFVKMDLKSISSFKNSIQTVGIKNVLKNFNLVPREKLCDKCAGNMKLNIRATGIVHFRCGKNTCRASVTIRNNTVLSLVRIRPEIFLCVLLGWILKYPLSVIVKEVCVSRNTVTKLINIFRDVLTYWLLETSEKIGGVGEIVEIDESAFGKRKYNVGRITKVRWVVGGIDRRSKKCFLKVVDKRDANTLVNIINENVVSGSTIITDMWRGYRTLQVSGFQHFTVNHSTNFVSPNNKDIHTQTIESQWSKIKRDMRRRIGRMSVSSFESYLVEYVWRSLHDSEETLFYNFIQAVNYFYPQ